MEKIVFITPYFGRTGSELLLFEYLTRLKNIEVLVLSKHNGELRKSLPRHIKFYSYSDFKKNRVKYILHKTFAVLFKSSTDYFDQFLKTFLPVNSKIYINTIVLPEAISYMVKNNLKFILHSHELEQVLERLDRKQITNLVESPSLILTSSLTAKKVMQHLGRDKKLTHVHPGLDIKKLSDIKLRRNIKEFFNIPEDHFVVVMSGSCTYNKNPNLFVETAKLLLEKGLKVYFVWIGADKNNGYFEYIIGKTKFYNIESNVQFMNKISQEDYFSIIDCCDLFFLTSFKESFSLVTLEALYFGKPVLSLNSGGPSEIINNDNIGVILKSYNPEDIAPYFIEIVEGRKKFNKFDARKRAEEFSIECSFEKWFEVINNPNYDSI